VLADGVVSKRAVEEIGAQRGEDADPATGVVDGGGQCREKAVRHRRRCLGEQLLELVDDEEELRPALGQDGVDRSS